MEAEERTFVALRPPPEVCAALSRAAQDTLGTRPGLRLYPPEDLHLTLAFLGPLSVIALGRLALALDRACLERPAVELRTTHTGAFPGRGRERILWAGFEPSEALPRLFDAALAAAREAGCEPPDAGREARVPHVTLARVRGPRVAVPEAFHALRFDLAWTAREVVVCQSDPRADPRANSRAHPRDDLSRGAASRYPIVHRAPLCGGLPG